MAKECNKIILENVIGDSISLLLRADGVKLYEQDERS